MKEKISTIKEAQRVVKYFAERNGWKDKPTIDQFDHLHEELIEDAFNMAQKEILAKYNHQNEENNIVRQKV